MTAAEFPPGIDAEVWEEVEWGDWALTKADERFLIGRPYRYFVHREPTPTMPVLPSEATFVATACGCTDSYCAAREGARRAYRVSFEGDE